MVTQQPTPEESSQAARTVAIVVGVIFALVIPALTVWNILDSREEEAWDDPSTWWGFGTGVFVSLALAAVGLLIWRRRTRKDSTQP